MQKRWTYFAIGIVLSLAIVSFYVSMRMRAKERSGVGIVAAESPTQGASTQDNLRKQALEALRRQDLLTLTKASDRPFLAGLDLESAVSVDPARAWVALAPFLAKEEWGAPQPEKEEGLFQLPALSGKAQLLYHEGATGWVLQGVLLQDENLLKNLLKDAI